MKLLRKIKIHHLTGNIKDHKVQKIIEFFEEIFSNMIECYSDDYPKSTFFKYKGKIYFELDFKDNITQCRYEDFWEKFETDFKLNYKEIKWLTHYMFRTHLKRWVPSNLRADGSLERVIHCYPFLICGWEHIENGYRFCIIR